MWMGRLPLRVFAIVTLCAAAAVGCGGSTATPSPVTTPVPATASPTAAVTEAPTAAPTVETVRTLCAKGTDECVIPAGTYSTAPFTPPFVFTIESAWNNTRAFPEGGGISAQGGAINWVSGTADGWVGAVENIEIKDPSDVTAYVDALRSEKGYTVGDITPAQLGGIDALQVDVFRAALKSTGAGFILPEDRYVFGPGTKSRVLFVETPGGWAIILAEAIDDDVFEAFLSKAQPVLDSVAWE